MVHKSLLLLRQLARYGRQVLRRQLPCARGFSRVAVLLEYDSAAQQMVGAHQLLTLSRRVDVHGLLNPELLLFPVMKRHFHAVFQLLALTLVDNLLHAVFLQRRFHVRLPLGHVPGVRVLRVPHRLPDGLHLRALKDVEYCPRGQQRTVRYVQHRFRRLAPLLVRFSLQHPRHQPVPGFLQAILTLLHE